MVPVPVALFPLRTTMLIPNTVLVVPGDPGQPPIIEVKQHVVLLPPFPPQPNRFS